jgi:hypothetical protein
MINKLRLKIGTSLLSYQPSWELRRSHRPPQAIFGSKGSQHGIDISRQQTEQILVSLSLIRVAEVSCSEDDFARSRREPLQSEIKMGLLNESNFKLTMAPRRPSRARSNARTLSQLDDRDRLDDRERCHTAY